MKISTINVCPSAASTMFLVVKTAILLFAIVAVSSNFKVFYKKLQKCSKMNLECESSCPCSINCPAGCIDCPEHPFCEDECENAQLENEGYKQCLNQAVDELVSLKKIEILKFFSGNLFENLSARNRLPQFVLRKLH